MYRKLFSAGWYVIYTKSNQEKKLYARMKDKYKVYLPLKRELRQWSDRKKWVELPLFNSYIFIYLNDYDEYHSTLNMGGMNWYVSFEGKILRVRDNEIDKIKHILDNFDSVEVSSDEFQVGEKHTIKRGPLIGYDCEIVRRDGQGRILVKLESLRQVLMVEVKAQHLTRVYA